MTAKKILETARSQLDIKENPPNSNKCKFNTAYYGREVSGGAYPWCCVFVWWVFREAGASKLFYGGGKTASCSTLLGFHKGQAIQGNYLPGDFYGCINNMYLTAVWSIPSSPATMAGYSWPWMPATIMR